MKRNISFLSSDEKTMIHAVEWIPEGEPRAVIQIIHGMIEYIERYSAFAEYMNTQGFLVVGHDQLGHGSSVRSVEDWGYIADTSPARLMVRDIHKLRGIIQERYPGLPIYMLGHSMGSYLLRRYITNKGTGLAGAIVVGTGCESDTITKLGLTLIRGTARSNGWHYRSDTLQNMTYNSGYKKYDLTRTDLENSWICSDPEIMRGYYADPRCSFTFTTSGFEALLSSVLFTNQKVNIDMIPRKLPIYILSGEGDPVGGLGKGVKKVYDKYVRSGIQDVECKLYPDMRHEILNEPGKQEVYDDITDWINRKNPSR